MRGPFSRLLTCIGMCVLSGCSSHGPSDREVELLRDRVPNCQPRQCPVARQHVIAGPLTLPDQTVGESIVCQTSCFYVQGASLDKGTRFDEVVCVVFRNPDQTTTGFVYFHDRPGAHIRGFIWAEPTERWLLDNGCLPQRADDRPSAG